MNLLKRSLWIKFLIFCKRWYVKIVRNDGSPEYIARGVALGLFIGMFIPMFFQIMVVIPLAFIFRAAKAPAVICTFVTNHFTVFVIYPIQCYIGSYLIFRPFSYSELTQKLKDFIAEPAFSSFIALGKDIPLTFFAGGLLFGIILAVPGYFLTIKAVIKYRKEREKRFIKKQKKFEN